MYGVTEGRFELLSKLIPFKKELDTVGTFLGLPFDKGALDDEGLEKSCRAAGLLCSLALFNACFWAICLGVGGFDRGLGPGDIELISDVAFCRSFVTNFTHFLIESWKMLVESIDPAVRRLLARFARLAALMFAAD